MEKINKLLNSRVIQLKSSPGSKTKQLSYALLNLEKYEYDTSITYVGINNLIRFDNSSSNLVSIVDNINAELRCRNFNIGKKLI